jgi:anti-sigma-K factor RskA
MSGLMSDVDHTDALAAEYVLGTLDSEEREQARALLGADTAFAVKVAQWERRLGELHLMVEPVEPDAKIWTRIKSKMPETQSRSNARLPEAHIPEPAPVAIPAAAPSLDAIQATISETTAVLTSEAAAAPASEAASPAWEAGSPGSEVTEAPVSEVIEAFGSEPSSLPTSEPSVAMSEAAAEVPTRMPDAALAPDMDAAPAPTALESASPMTDATPTSTLDAAAVPARHATPTPAAIVETESAPPAVPPVLATAIVPTPDATRRINEATRQAAAARRGLRRWRAFAILMTLAVLAVAALLAAWRFAPERVPPMLQPIEVLRQVGVELPSARSRRPVPPPSQLEE